MIWCEGGGGMVVAGIGGEEGRGRECILGCETSNLPVVRGVKGGGGGEETSYPTLVRIRMPIYKI